LYKFIIILLCILFVGESYGQRRTRGRDFDTSAKDTIASIVGDSSTVLRSEISDSLDGPFTSTKITADTFKTTNGTGGMQLQLVQQRTYAWADTFALNSGGSFYRKQWTASAFPGLTFYNNAPTGRNIFLEHLHMNQETLGIKGGTSRVDRIVGRNPEDRYIYLSASDGITGANRDNFDDLSTIQSGTIGTRDHFAFGDVAYDGDTLWTAYRAAEDHIDPDSTQIWMEYSVDEGLTWVYSNVTLDSGSNADLRGPGLSFLSDDSLYLVQNTIRDDSTYHVYVWKSGDKGRTWGSVIPIANGSDSGVDGSYITQDKVHELPNGEIGFMFYEIGSWKLGTVIKGITAGDTSKVWYAYSGDMGGSWDTSLVATVIDTNYWISEPSMVVYPEAPLYNAENGNLRIWGSGRVVDHTVANGIDISRANQIEWYSNDAGRTWATRTGSAFDGTHVAKNDPPEMEMLPSNHIVCFTRDSSGAPHRIYISDEILDGTGWPSWQGYTTIDLEYGYPGIAHLGGGRFSVVFMRQSSQSAGRWKSLILDVGVIRYQLENSRLRTGEVYPMQNYALHKKSDFAGTITLTAATSDTMFIPGLYNTDIAIITQDGATPLAGNRSAEVKNNFLVIHSDSTITGTFNYWILRKR